MEQVVPEAEPMIVRQVFPRWTITIPADFDGTALIATIISDDLAWAAVIWQSIRRTRTPGDA